MSAFQSHGVRYLVVGGFAVIYHSQPRFTKDIDLLIASDPANAEATFAALSSFGAPLENITAADFTDGNNFFRSGYDPNGFDILPAIPGVDFIEAWDRRVEVIVDPNTNLTAYLISAQDLIALKLATGRVRHLADVEEIRKAADSSRHAKTREIELTTSNQ